MANRYSRPPPYPGPPPAGYPYGAQPPPRQPPYAGYQYGAPPPPPPQGQYPPPPPGSYPPHGYPPPPAPLGAYGNAGHTPYPFSPTSRAQITSPQKEDDDSDDRDKQRDRKRGKQREREKVQQSRDQNRGKSPPASPSAVPTDAPTPRQLASAYPSRLTYRPPYGTAKQGFLVKLTSANDRLAFKVQANVPTWKFFTVNPTRGTIDEKSVAKVDFVMNDGFASKDLERLDEENKYFQVQVISWPTTRGFDPQIWKELASETKVQTIKLVIDIDKAEQGPVSQRIPTPTSRPDQQYMNMPEHAPPAAPTADDAKPASTGPQHLVLYPKVLCYRPPYGQEEQTNPVDVRSLGRGKVAFKVQGSSHTWKFFRADPPSGVLAPGETKKLNFIMNAGFKHEELQTQTVTYSFNVVALPWVDKVNEFDDSLWKDLSSIKKHELQTEVMKVDLDKSGMFVTQAPPAAPAAPPQPEFLDQPSKPQPSPVAAYHPPPPAYYHHPPPTYAHPPHPHPATGYPPQPTPVSSDDSSSPSPIRPAPSKEREEEVLISEDMIRVRPETLRFEVPGNQKKTVEIRNVSATSAIGFKIQATLSQFYAVKPNQGVIEPLNAINASFEPLPRLTPGELKQFPTIKHKFIIVAAVWSASKPYDRATMKDIEGKHKTVSINLTVEHDVKDGQPNRTESAEDPSKRKADAKDTGSSTFIPKKSKSTKKSSKGAKSSAGAKTSAGAKHSPEAKSSDAHLVNVTPSSIKFTPPYGTKKNVEFALENMTSDTIAFKVLSNKCMYYYVNPGKGLIKANGTCKIDLQMSDKFTDKEAAKAVPDSHKLKILSVAWPETKKQFESKHWDELHKQKLTKTIDKIVQF